MFLKTLRRRGHGGASPRTWAVPLAAAALAFCTVPAYAQVSAYTALPPVKLTTVSHPWVLATTTDSANALLADAAYEPITGGTLLVDGSQAATESNTVTGTGYTALELGPPGFFSTPGSWRPAAWAGVPAFVGNGAEIGVGNQTRNGPGLPIGFPFTFNSQEFDRIGISSQGWISFGKSTDGATAVRVHTSTAQSTNNLPLANTAVINNDARRHRVAAYGVQGGTWSGSGALVPYVFQSGYSGYPGSTLRMETIGTAPNRICVVQWENFAVWPTGSLSAPDPGLFRFMNFQIRLHENGDKVEVRYGDCRRGPGVSSFNQIGLGGAAATDYKGWQRSGGWPTSWNGTYDVRQALPDPDGFTAMTGNTQQISGSASGTPDMLSFMFTPPACPQQASAVNITNLDTTSATVNWTGSGTFDYAVSTTNNVAAATITGTVTGNSALVTGLLPETNYYVFVRTNCDPDFSLWSSSVNFKTFFSVACGSQWTDPGGPIDPNPSTGYINTYVFCPENPAEKATLDFTTWSQMNWNLPQSSPMFIHDGYGLAAPLIPGTGTGYSCTGCNNGFASWSVPAGGWINEPPLITSTAANGCLTVQVYSYGLWVNEGWIADVTCALPPTCFPPTDRTVTATAAQGATFSWTSSSPSVDFIVVANGGTPASPVLASGSSGTGAGSVTGLTPDTQYTAFFRGSCDDGADLSVWSDPGLNFRTEPGCGAPYNFNLANSTYSIVKTICPDNAGDAVTISAATLTYSGAGGVGAYGGSLYVYDGPTTASPLLNSYFDGQGGLPSGGYNNLSTPSRNVPTITSSDPGGCLTLWWRNAGGNLTTNYTTNVTCAAIPCAVPNAVTAGNVGATSATITWSNTSAPCIIEYGPVGFTPGTGAAAGTNGTVVANATSGEVLSLNTTTVYDVYVRQVCDGSIYSANSFRVRFSTSVDCAQAVVLACSEFTTAPLVFEAFGSPVYQGSNYAQAPCVNSIAGANGAERLYRITAPVSGSYQLDITGAPTTGSASFMTTPVSNGCGAAAFTCITNTVNSPTFPNGPIPSQTTLSLTAGDHYILLDPNAYSTGAITFRVNCPGIPACVTTPTFPPNGAVLAVTTAGTVFSWPASFGATSYDVYFQGNYVANTPTNSINGGSGYSTANIAALFGIGNTITWRVVPRNADGIADCPTNFTFSVGGNGASNAIPLAEGQVRVGNNLASNLHSSTNTNNWGPDAWYAITASPCATSITVNLCPTGGITPSSSNAYSDNGFASVTVRRVSDNSQVLYVEDNSAGATAGCVLGAGAVLPSFAATPDESYYIIADGYGWQYNFNLSYDEVGNDDDFDGDGIPDCADSCPELAGEEGDPCYAGPLFTSGEIIGCECVGAGPVPCSNDLTLEFQTDDSPWETTWALIEQGTDFVVQQGGPLNPQNSVETNFTCLPDGCYYLRVYDAAGDGMTTGGYQLRTSTNQRIIDNSNNFSGGLESGISGGQGFCLPLGTVAPIFSSCDKLDWVTNKFIVCAENAAVAAQFGVTNATSGYEFWFFDPNGTYSFRRFRSHSTSDGFGSGSTRACHFKLNKWINTGLTPHLPEGVLLNVRVRGRVAGVNQEFGPACQFKMDASLAACPRVKLQDNPANTSDFSCGVSRNFGPGTGNRITANPPQPIPAVASNMVRYQFRFRNEERCIVRPPQTSPTLVMNWTTGDLLVCTETYDVDVRVSLDGGATWCFGLATTDQASNCADTEDWGKVCSVTINPCAQGAQGGSSNINGTGTLSMYPNPNNGQQLFLSLSEVAADVTTVAVDIYDMTGKRVSASTIAVQDGFVTTAMELNGEIADGLYMVNITAGDKAYTERLVIQK